MGYQIEQTENAEITMFSTNNVKMMADNVIVENSTLGSEHVDDWDMVTVDGKWIANNADIAKCTFDSKTCCRVELTGPNPGGIRQTTLWSNLTVGKKYKITAMVYGYSLTMGEFTLNVGGVELVNTEIANGEWVALEGTFIATSVNPEISVLVENDVDDAVYYIDFVTMKEIVDGNLEVNGKVGIGVYTNLNSRLNFPGGSTSVDGIQFGTDTNLYRGAIDKLQTDDNMEIGGSLNVLGCIAGRVPGSMNKVLVGDGSERLSYCSTTVSDLSNISNLSANFLPALFGMHKNASASITYGGGSGGFLPSVITWTSVGYEVVTQTITYNGNDQPTQIVTQGGTYGRTATETLTWSGDNLTNYSIAFN